MNKILFLCLFILLSFASVSSAEVYDTDTIKEVDCSGIVNLAT